MKAADLIKQYRENINPPYSRKDVISVSGTLFLLIAIPLTVILATQARESTSQAQEAVKPQTAGAVEEVQNENLKLLQLNSQLVQAAPAQKGKILAGMKSVATVRKSRLKVLLDKNSKEAERMLLPKEISVTLPAELQSSLEQPVTANGTLEILAIDDFSKKEAANKYFLRTAAERFSLYPTGDFKIKAGTDLKISGTALDDKIVFEPDKTQVSNVLGETTGDQKVIVLMVNFQDNPSQPFDAATAATRVFTSTNNYYKEVSFNKASLSGDVVGWYTMPIAQTCDGDTILTNAIAVSDPYVFFPNYSRIIITFPVSSGCGWAGMGTVGKWGISTADGNILASVSWDLASYFQPSVIGHELGHNFGVGHANFLECGLESIGESCTEVEYGDYYDIMGTAGYMGHFNGRFKEAFTWFDPVNVLTASPGTSVTIYPIESTSAGVQAAKVVREKDQNNNPISWYYIEFRQPTGYDASLPGTDVFNGALIHYFVASDYNTYLIDTTPNSSADSYTDRIDSALGVGKKLTDSAAGLEISTVSEGSGNLTVSVNSIPVPCERANPLVAVDPSTAYGNPGSKKSYTITATNNDNSSCGASTFSLTTTNVPSGWTASFTNSQLSINPGSSSTTTLDVTSAAGASENYYDISVTATNQLDAAYNDSEIITYVVTTSTQPPTVDIKANNSNGPITIAYNTAATLSWTSSNATSCTASNGWSGSKGTSGSTSTGRLTSSRTYTLTCTGTGGSASDTVVVYTGKIGDLNLDNSINIRDISILVSRWASGDQTADLNSDGVVNIRDISILVSRWGT